MSAMTITHKTVIGEDGEPSAALIPWSEFLRIKKLLGADEDVTSEEAEAMREAEEDRRNGNTEAFTDLADLKAELSL